MTYYRKHQKKAINRKSVTPVEPADKNKIRNETFANDTWEDKGVVLKKFQKFIKIKVKQEENKRNNN